MCREIETITAMIHLAIIVLELIGIYLSYRHVKEQIFLYYTEISNALTLLSSILYLLSGGNVPLLRYLSSCMLTMTALISLLVLSPAGGFKETMLSGECFYHHTLVPLISTGSYIFLEPHSHLWHLPVLITFVYGIVMIIFNSLGMIEGPYDFLMIRKNGSGTTAKWIILMLLVISLISAGISLITR